MNQTATILSSIIEFLLGKKYYANIIITRGTTRRELASFIFRSRSSAERHKEQLAQTSSFQYAETISFRSHKEYPDAYGNN
ncbi:MAG: hypothetical protein NC212_08550 [Staphylococcus sp.]|nr:hypothetical protein [Staphylococcus sp.]